MEKIDAVYGTKPNRYRVVDARDWNFGFTVQEEVREDVFADVIVSMTKHDAMYTSMRMAGMAEKEASR